MLRMLQFRLDGYNGPLFSKFYILKMDVCFPILVPLFLVIVSVDILFIQYATYLNFFRGSDMI